VSTEKEHATQFVPPVETHLLRSRHVAQSFKIQVMQPLQRRGELRRFPVVYGTDGNFAFDVLKGISHSIQTSARNAEPYIVVGIGYPGDSPLAGSLLRVRDLTCPGYPKLSTEPPAIEGVLSSEPGTDDFGGAERFKKFIHQELIPFIDARYPTLCGDRTYFGHSAGGGFGLYTLFTTPEIFKNYIISSPGLIFHGESAGGGRYDDYDFMLQKARRAIAASRDFGGAKLYLSVGSEEEFEPELAKWRMKSSFDRMVALLIAAQPRGLALTTEVFREETHMTVWPMAFIHGIQAVLGARTSGCISPTSIGDVRSC
jgi:uncharacterized protein